MGRRLENRKVIITGASGGIGEQMAWQVAKRGGIPILIARSTDKLAAITAEISSAYKQGAYYYSADFLEPVQIEEVFARILKDHKQIDALINNAGAGKFEYAWETSTEQTAEMFQLNVLAVMEATRLMLPLFFKQGFGHVVIVGSQAGKIATPKSSVYAATKHAVLGYANALRLEVYEKGIAVTTVNPGPVETDFFSTADPGGGYKKKVQHFMLRPGRVAQKTIQSLLKHKREINLPFWMEAGGKVYHLMPGVIEQAFRKQFNKK